MCNMALYSGAEEFGTVNGQRWLLAVRDESASLHLGLQRETKSFQETTFSFSVLPR